ncbi:VOC family protein [Chryseobacterium sp. SSA4.19]|uniref:bleomycin resistance protein n=1 Tax=Chryseobacterium sp. SSA4.19 TaxID=2919915 RepID=UPI001F4E04F1|nr:VOC family protein [Chryseobacterium sp. SSA4.19]MCJ8154889.1 VOC family protein [Chryseobacterium sp. SSA4.19]
MMTSIIPKLPMRNKDTTRNFYEKLGFKPSENDFPGYLMMKNESVEIHFFEFTDLVPAENYGQVYIRISDIETLYSLYLEKNIEIHPAGSLGKKAWGQKEFSILDPDNNLITFGQAL